MTRTTRRSVPVALVTVCAVLATAPAAAQDRIKLDRSLQSRAARGGQTTTRVIIRLRDGASDQELADIFVQAVAHKEKKHQINEGEQFQRASRSMSQIGG